MSNYDELDDKLEGIRSRRDLSEFVGSLANDCVSSPEDWENAELSSFLFAMAAWIEDMDAYYRNHGKPFDESQPWKTFAEILLASRTYE